MSLRDHTQHLASVGRHLRKFEQIASFPSDELRKSKTEQASLRTPSLHAAIAGGFQAVCALLLEQGTNVLEVDEEQKTALHVAAAHHNLQVCKALLVLGADVNAQDAFGQTALHAMAGSNNADLCLLLLQHGANVDIQDSAGNSALHYATRYRSDTIARILAYSGADLTLENIASETPLHHASNKLYMELSQLQDHILQIAILCSENLHHLSGSTDNSTYVQYELNTPLTTNTYKRITTTVNHQDSPEYQDVVAIPVKRTVKLLSYLESGSTTFQVFRKRLIRRDELLGSVAVPLRLLVEEGEVSGKFPIMRDNHVTAATLDVRIE